MKGEKQEGDRRNLNALGGKRNIDFSLTKWDSFVEAYAEEPWRSWCSDIGQYSGKKVGNPKKVH